MYVECELLFFTAHAVQSAPVLLHTDFIFTCKSQVSASCAFFFSYTTFLTAETPNPNLL